MSLRIRIAAVTAAALVAAPALAADRVQDCTVCKDPTWPTIENPMPGVGLNAPAAEDRTGIPGDATWQVASNRSAGVGVVASTGGRGSVYSDPTWPSATLAAGGMPASVPAPAAPARPSRAPAGGVASR